MGAWLIFGLKILVFALIVLVVFNALNIFVFSKIKVNKWIVLGGILLTVVVSPILLVYKIDINGTLWQYLLGAVFGILFLWFLDLSGFRKSKGSKSAKKQPEIVIRSKAKPNRVKNKNK